MFLFHHQQAVAYIKKIGEGLPQEVGQPPNMHVKTAWNEHSCIEVIGCRPHRQCVHMHYVQK
jgi:hypothetical protein